MGAHKIKKILKFLPSGSTLNLDFNRRVRKYYLNTLPPKISVRINKTRKIQKKTFAIAAAPAATPPKPKMAAIIAITTKIMAHLSIIIKFYFKFIL